MKSPGNCFRIFHIFGLGKYYYITTYENLYIVFILFGAPVLLLLRKDKFVKPNTKKVSFHQA